MEKQDCYQRGWEKLNEIDGEGGKRVIESLEDIAPDFARYLIEFPFGDIYSRPGLDLKSREIAAVAALTALGNAAPQLKWTTSRFFVPVPFLRSRVEANEEKRYNRVGSGYIYE